MPVSEPPPRAAVLVHGVGSSSRAYRRLVPVLAPHAQVHAVDLPGFGSSPRPRHDVPVGEHAAVLADYVRTHVLGAGLPAPVLVGHSMGTQVVAQALADFPGVGRAAVLVGPTSDPRARTIRQQAARLARDATAEPPSAVAQLLWDALVRCRPPYYLAQLRHVVGHHLEEVLPGVDVPVVVVRGHRDPVAPEPWARMLSEVTAHGELRTVTGGHHAMESDPVGVAAAVLHAWRAADRGAR